MTERSPWGVVGVILLGSYTAALNTTVVGVALPQISHDLVSPGAALDVDWVVTAFLIGVVLMQPATASVSDRIGRRRLYVGCLALVLAGAVTGWLAPSMPVLLAGRLAMGIGSGALMPLGQSMVYDLFPPGRRGTALGVWGVGTIGAPAAGPSVGGWIVATMGWRWIFGFIATFAIVAIVLSARRLPADGDRHRDDGGIDVRGWAAFGVVSVGVAILARQAATWGLASWSTLAGTGLCVVALGYGVRRTLRARHPIIELRLFATSAFVATMAVIALLSVIQFARNTYLPIELQVVRGLDASHVGFLLAPGALATGAAMTVGGWVADRIGRRAPVAIGLSCSAVAGWGLATLTPEVSTSRVVLLLVIGGAGGGLVFIGTTLVGMDCVPTGLTAHASSMTSLNRQFAGSIGVAALGAMLVADLGAVAPAAVEAGPAQDAYNGVFTVGLVLNLLALPLVLALPGRRQRSGQPVPGDSSRTAPVAPLASSSPKRAG